MIEEMKNYSQPNEVENGSNTNGHRKHHELSKVVSDMLWTLTYMFDELRVMKHAIGDDKICASRKILKKIDIQKSIIEKAEKEIKKLRCI